MPSITLNVENKINKVESLVQLNRPNIFSSCPACLRFYTRKTERPFGTNLHDDSHDRFDKRRKEYRIRIGVKNQCVVNKNATKERIVTSQNPFLPKRIGKTAEAGPNASSQKRDTKAEQFHRAGRSMSAPDSYDLHTSGR